MTVKKTCPVQALYFGRSSRLGSTNSGR